MTREPVIVGALIRAAAVAAGAFGLDMTGEQIAAVVIVVELITSWLTRRRVTPVTPS